VKIQYPGYGNNNLKKIKIWKKNQDLEKNKNLETNQNLEKIKI